MTAYYFDTNTLVYWAESRAKSVCDTNVEMKIGTLVERLILDPSVRTAVSEITLAEFHDVICAKWRDGNRPELSEEWADEVESALMKWIEQSRLHVLPMPPKLIEKAMNYVMSVTREKQGGLRAWDAAHTNQAVEWARELGEVVIVVTRDGDFEKLLKIYPEFRRFVNLLNPAN